MKTLEKYLRDNAPVCDFAFRAAPAFADGRLQITIHPLDKSGETVDYYVHGNVLAPLDEHDEEHSLAKRAAEILKWDHGPGAYHHRDTCDGCLLLAELTT